MAQVPHDRPQGVADEAAELARGLVAARGCYSSELGIDVTAGDDEVERWFLAATLFGNRIAAAVAMQTFRVLDHAGIRTVADAGRATWDELVELLDAGGYARYDFRTASRLQGLARALEDHYQGRVSELARSTGSSAEVEAALDALPGWGPVTVRLFLRELRGVWPTADPPLDERARWAAVHLGLLADGERDEMAHLAALAARAGSDPSTLESALVHVALAHRARRRSCPGRNKCFVLTH